MTMSDCPLIRLKNATVMRGGRHVLQSLHWELHAGQHWLIVGANGAGKSTLLQVLRGELWPLATSAPARQYCFDGDMQESAIGLRTRMGLVSPALQERYQRTGWNIGGLEVAASGFDDTYLLNRSLTEAERARLDAVLTQCGAADLVARPLSSFSQGELRLLLLVRALAPLTDRPAILFLDEGFEGLDVPARRRMTEVLERLMAQDDGLSVLLTAHRLDELPQGLTHGLQLEHGRIVRQEPIDVFCAAAAPAPSVQRPACPLLTRERVHTDAPLLTIEHADVYVDRARVLQDISWVIAPPPMTPDDAAPRGHWAVLGSNGAGKSTLLRLIQGELPPALGGSISMPLAPAALERRRAAPLLSSALQATYTYDDSAMEVVISGFFGSIGLWEPHSPQQEAMALQWLDFLGMGELSMRRLSTLSTGQARRVFLARALAPCPPLVLLDEPCAGLDPQAREVFLDTLSRAAGLGPLFVMVTHHPEDCLPQFSNVLVLEAGQVAYAGPREACPAQWLPASEKGAPA